MGFDLSEKKVRRAGLDYWPHLDLTILKHWSPADCPNRFFLFTKNAKKSVFDVKFKKDDWLIFGAEPTGLPPAMLEQYEEHCLKLPQYGPVRSQNLSNAVSAACYLALKDLNQEGQIVQTQD